MVEKDRKTMLAKVHAFREELSKQDWSDDKIYSGGGKSYGYVSADKVKQNFGPMAIKHGLEVVFNFDELQMQAPMGMMSQHWTLKATMTLVDIDTGEGVTYSAYGEAGDSGDKGVNKAQTDALKQIIFSSFMVADNADPDAVSVDTVVPVASKYKPKSEAEQIAVKSAVMAKAVPAPAPAPETKAVPAPKIPVKAPAPVPAPVMPTPAKIAPKASVPAPAKESEVMPIYANAMKAIIQSLRMEVTDGTRTSAEVDAIESEVERITTNADAMAFIGRFQA